MRAAPRPFLWATVALVVLWSANAHALYFFDLANHQGSESEHQLEIDFGRGTAVFAFSSQPSHLSLSISYTGPGDECSGNFGACLGHNRPQLVFSNDGWFSDHSAGHFDFRRLGQVHGRQRPELTHPVPEPQAALVFLFGIGIVAARIRH